MLKSFAMAAAVAGALAATSPAAAAASQTSDEIHPPGNCPQSVLCIWPDFNPWGTPSLVTDANWSGKITGFYFYNRTSRSVEITQHFSVGETVHTFTRCANPGGGDLYMASDVTKVNFRTGTCTW